MDSLLAFVVIWVITFPIAWVLLVRFFVSARMGRWVSVVLMALLYLLVIVAPYVPVILDKDMGFLSNIFVAGALLATILAVGALLSETKLMQMLWGGYSYFYDSLNKFYAYQELQDIVIQASDIEHSKDASILDLGGGTGNLLNRILTRYPDNVKNASLVEPTNKMRIRAIRKLSDHNGVNLEFSEMDHMQFAQSDIDTEYDKVFIVNSLYTLSLSSKKALLAKVKTIMATDGRLIIVDPDQTGSIDLLRYQIVHKGIWSSINVGMVMVGFFDFLINELSKGESFNYTDAKDLKKICDDIGIKLDGKPVRVYGGKVHGIALLYTISF